MRALRPWHLLLALAALAVPLQAGALTGDDPGPAGLSVSASLGECGVSEAGISCRIDASWTGVEEATRYTATVTLADGAVTDMGTVGTGPGGGSGSFWVPYVGDGVYTVTVTAWGTDPDGREKKLDEKDAKAEAEDPKRKDGERSDKDEDGRDEEPEDDEGPASDGGGQGNADNGGNGEQPKQPGETAPEPEPAPEQPPPEVPAEPKPEPEPPAEPNPVGPDGADPSGPAAGEGAAGTGTGTING